MKILETLDLRSSRGGAAAGLAAPVLSTLLLGLAAGVAPASAQAPGYSGSGEYTETAGYEGSYSYVRTLEGSATLIQGDTGDRDALQANQPVLVGDRLLVAPRGRAEVILSDRNRLRIDGASEVVFEALAGSPDRQDRMTVLRVPQGNVQLLVVSDFLGEGLPRVDTPNLTVYPRDAGSFRITADGSDWSEVVARDGSAEVVTREGSVLLRQGEEAVVEGDHRTRSRVRRASREDSLELWGRRLDQEARYAAAPYVDDSLRYEAASLDRHGSWVTVEGRYAWRPRVAVEWRPYHHGRWAFSPLGLTWVSYEPWGWVPYHYGSWDNLPGYGWVWYPGRRFAPAWVYWNWTDHYVGWVPIGYYASHYRPFGGHHFRFGIYGWTGGHWSHYHHWNFCTLGRLGHRDQHRFVRDGDRFGREHRIAVPRRGLLTTDTRGITRTAVRRSEGIVEALSARRQAAARELPDMTPFVARRAELPDDVRSRILVERGRGGSGSGPDRGVRVIDPEDVLGRSPGAVRSARPGATEGIDRARGRTAEGIPGRAPERVERPSGPSGERTAPTLSPRPARSPEAVRPDDASRESWRDRPETLRSAPRAPRASRPPAPSNRDRSTGETPRRIEPRPQSPLAARSGSERPADARRELPSSWRERPPVRPPERSERPSVPRRVIDGVRSNAPGSTPFRSVEPSDRPRRSEAIQPRSAPSTERRSGPRRVEPSSRPAPPPRAQPRIDSRRSRSSSSPPPRASSSRSSGSRSPEASSRSPSRSSRSSSARSSSPRSSRSSSARSSSGSSRRSSSARSSSRSSSGRSSSGRSAPSRRKPPGS